VGPAGCDKDSMSPVTRPCSLKHSQFLNRGAVATRPAVAWGGCPGLHPLQARSSPNRGDHRWPQMSARVSWNRSVSPRAENEKARGCGHGWANGELAPCPGDEPASLHTAFNGRQVHRLIGASDPARTWAGPCMCVSRHTGGPLLQPIPPPGKLRLSPLEDGERASPPRWPECLHCASRR
jgi:hypothetical protein